MKIKWFGHASFLIETNGIRVITDPYNPATVTYRPIEESADLVVRSSADDRGHNNAEMIRGDPKVLTATDIIGQSWKFRGLTFNAIAVRESLIHKESPIDNAMYTIDSADLRLAHMGDVGNPLTDDQIDGLRGCDVLLALTGGPPTIELDDLMTAIEAIGPKVVIPMHYAVPNVGFKMLDIHAFTDRFDTEAVQWAKSSEIALTRESLPTRRRIVVLEPVCGR